ncbi:pentapeptide repeat-containing protein [Nocardia brasiliensis]|uniref:pentapeptide repeat-containing protein n=1 Tax=Nocardia brasiliensis TaxID=37326 RepID=UPI0033CB695B
MTKTYGRSRDRVIRWPDDVTARQVLERYLDKLSAESPSTLSIDSLLPADGLNLTGADLSGLQFQEAAFNEADLSGVRLVEADLYQAWMISANLTNADLTRADVRKAQGRGAKAIDAIFRESQLQGSTFEGADFRRADLRGANLLDASFPGADLRGANLSGCHFGWTDFSDSRLGECVVADAVGMVLGPIDIGSTTAQLLGGPALKAWFTDNGAPEVEIYLPQSD